VIYGCGIGLGGQGFSFGRKTILINSGCSLIHFLGGKSWISGCGVQRRMVISRLTLCSFYWTRGLWLTLVFVCCPGCVSVWVVGDWFCSVFAFLSC